MGLERRTMPDAMPVRVSGAGKKRSATCAGPDTTQEPPVGHNTGAIQTEALPGAVPCRLLQCGAGWAGAGHVPNVAGIALKCKVNVNVNGGNK